MRERLILWRYLVAAWLGRIPDNLCMWLAWKLPSRLVMWSAIRVGAHATTGDYSGQDVPALTFMDALKRWPDPEDG